MIKRTCDREKLTVGTVWQVLCVCILLLSSFVVPFITYAQEGAESADILFSKAVIAYDEGRYDDALRDLLKAYEFDPTDLDVIYYLGLSYNTQKNYAQAEQYLRKGLAIRPKFNDIRYQLGVALHGQDNFDEALKEFLTVYQAEPQRENLGYYIGLCYYQKNDYPNALIYFQRDVSSDIRTRQMNHYYMGLTLRALGRETEAIEELAEAVRIEPASPIVASTQQLLTALRERGGEKPLRLMVTVNGQYDTNPNGDHHAKPSYGNLFNIRGDYTLYRSEHWESTATYAFLQTVNYEHHDFDIHDHFLAANLYYRYVIPGGMITYTGAQFSDDILVFGGRKFIQRPTGLASFTLQENPYNITTTFFRLQYKGFFIKATSLDERRTGFNELFGLLHFIRFAFAGGQHQINLGYHYDHENAFGENWRYSGHKAVAGLLIGLPWRLQATSNFEYHARFYPGRNSTSLKHRRDGEVTVLTTLGKEIAPGLTLALQHLWDTNDSSISDFRTRRQVYALGLTWRR